MVDVYLSRSATVVQSLVWAIWMVAWLLLMREIDPFGMYDESDRASSVESFVLHLIVAILVAFALALVFQWFCVKDEREAVGPRFDTDRAALRHALTSAELPTDESLDQALLVAIRRRRGTQTLDGSVPGRILLVLLISGLVVGLAISKAPWLAVVTLGLFAIALLRNRRRSGKQPRTLADLEADLRARLGHVTVSDPGGLTDADLDT